MTTLNLGRVVGQDGEDGRGIVSILKTATVGNVDTYTITYTDNTTSTFDVTNGVDGQDGAPGQDGEDGRGIVNIEKTSTSGLVDTYTITYTDGTTSTFEVTNGEGGGSTEDYTPYIFDYNFKTGEYDPLSGITEVTGGVTVTNGFSNKVVINKYISAEDCSYYADVTLADTNTVLCLSSVESNGGVHSSIVTFDFANAKINVYPKSNGSSIPATPYDTLSLTNVSGLDYKIEVGRKNRDFYARLTNNTTGKVEEIVIGDDSEGTTAYTYPVGWLHDYVAFSQISGNSAIWHRVYAALPKRDVVFLGDSITEGYGVSWKKTWVTLVADEIGHDKVLNMGSSGDQISQCQSITDTVLTILKPKVVVVTIGTNGGNTDANVKALHDSIVNLGAYPIFNYIYRGSNSVSANACIAKLKCEGARFDYETSVDYDLSKAKNSAMFQSDGLHLNDAGNQAVAQRFLKDCSWIKEFVEKQQGGGDEDLEEDVAQLKSDMTNVFSELEMAPATEVVQKSTFYAGVAISVGDGSELSEPTWASNKEYIQAKQVRCTDPTYHFVGRYYNTSTGGYNSGTPNGVRYTELDIPNDYYVKISARRVDNANITEADAEAMSDAIEFVISDPSGEQISVRLKDIEDGKQDALVSGGNIKTINGTSILGEGNITIGGGEEDLSVSDPIGDNALEFADEQGHIAMLVDNEGNIKTKAFDSSATSGTPSQLTDMVYELHRRTAANTTYPAFAIKGNVLVLGDSTVAGTNVGTKISALMSLASGYTLTDISQGGDTIQGQMSKYNNLSASVKSAVNYAVIQIGLNDVYPASASVAALKVKYQALVDAIKTNSPNAYIVISCMLPCRARWQALVPSTADHAQEVWAGLNQTIIDNEYGADAVASIHQWALAYNDFTLRSEYDTGDKIHENKAGQQVIVLSWLSAMFNNNSLTKGGNN